MRHRQADSHDRTLHKVKAQQGFNTDLAPWLRLVRDYGVWTTPDPLREQVCRDTGDDVMIEAALAGEARTIIARDAHSTVLERPQGRYATEPWRVF
jgi:hypothetical protein